MSGNDDDDSKVARRDALRLATAVSALGIGLGVELVSSEAKADDWETVTIKREEVGTLSLKIYKFDGANFTFLHALDLTGFAKSDMGTIALKLVNQKADNSEVVLMQHKVAFWTPQGSNKPGTGTGSGAKPR
jgi:hypothetical protein